MEEGKKKRPELFLQVKEKNLLLKASQQKLTGGLTTDHTTSMSDMIISH